MVRYVEGGTHEKDFAGVAATGRKTTWSGIGIFHLRDGKIHEEWLQSNMETKLAGDGRRREPDAGSDRGRRRRRPPRSRP